MTTDTTERGLEDLICTAMTGRASVTPLPGEGVHAPPMAFGGTGWLLGDAHDYDREYCVDLGMLRAFMEATQPEIATALELEKDSPVRRRFLARIESECAKRGVIALLRKGIKHEKYHIDLFYGTELLPHLEKRGEEARREAEVRLSERGRLESNGMRKILEEQKRRVEAEFGRTLPDQLTLAFNDDEKRQMESNRKYWQRWLAHVEVDLRKEPARIMEFYQTSSFRVEPVGLAYLWPVTG